MDTPTQAQKDASTPIVAWAVHTLTAVDPTPEPHAGKARAMAIRTSNARDLPHTLNRNSRTSPSFTV